MSDTPSIIEQSINVDNSNVTTIYTISLSNFPELTENPFESDCCDDSNNITDSTSGCPEGSFNANFVLEGVGSENTESVNKSVTWPAYVPPGTNHQTYYGFTIDFEALDNVNPGNCYHITYVLYTVYRTEPDYSAKQKLVLYLVKCDTSELIDISHVTTITETIIGDGASLTYMPDVTLNCL